MTQSIDLSTLDVGFDVPAVVGMDEADIQTPCLVLDLDALENNLKKMARYASERQIRLRAHAKMHKSIDVANLQHTIGGATGICVQKVSEAQVFVRGGINDVMITNQVRDPAKIDRLARLPLSGARIICCIDDLDNVDELSKAAVKHQSQIHCLVEIECGAGRCGVTSSAQALAVAKAIDSASGLAFAGIQAYQGAMQHINPFKSRQAAAQSAINIVKETIATLVANDLDIELVSGGGTGSYRLEGDSGVYNELQCGSYAFMDADYGRILDADDQRLDHSEWQNALFILTSIMSHSKSDMAVCDAGLKVQSVDSGLPVIYQRDDVEYVTCSDEHGVIRDPQGALSINDKLRLVPGHCDPTCNLHDWYVGVRNGKVESVWPVSARGKAY